MIDTEHVIESRFDRVEYLLETTKDLGNEEALLWEIVRAMSDREFHSVFLYMCRMRDIEPDMEKFQKSMEDSNYHVALQGC